MVCIQKYGITLKQLDRDNLELVRTWRNDPRINQYLLTRDHIGQDQQQKWFAKLDTTKHLYFIIEWEGNKVGLTQVTKIDRSQRTGYAGIFFCEEKPENRWLSYRAIVPLLDYCFADLELQTLFAEVLKSNGRAIRFNTAFGYQLVHGAGTDEYDLYVLQKETYFRTIDPLRKILERPVR